MTDAELDELNEHLRALDRTIPAAERLPKLIKLKHLLDSAGLESKAYMYWTGDTNPPYVFDFIQDEIDRAKFEIELGELQDRLRR